LKPGEKTPWPKDIRNNIFLLQNYSSMNMNPSSSKSIKAHDKPVSCISVHIKKHVVATGGDDCSFKIFNMTNYEELASCYGHSVTINIFYIFY
jgi:WD40 repeat protein